MEKQKLTYDQLDKAHKDFFNYRNEGKKHNDAFEIDYTKRYSSWDLCYNHFQDFFKKPEITPQDIKIAGLHLGFYLASWGMFRGSSKLLNSGIKIYEDLAEKLYEINGEDFSNQYNQVKNYLNSKKISSTHTLISKIMLGVYGNCPAIDSYFNKTATRYCGGIYERDNSEKVLEKINKILKIKINDTNLTFDEFIEEKSKAFGLSKYKILDGIFFTIGQDLS
jgi:hypothetical protein